MHPPRNADCVGDDPGAGVSEAAIHRPPSRRLLARRARLAPLRLRRRAAALLLFAFLAAGGACAGSAYRGLTTGLYGQLRYSTLDEGRNVWAYVSYLLAFLQKLTFDPARGIYDFRLTPDAGLDGFEQGRLAFHRGDFAGAAARLEGHLGQEGESEEALFWLALSYMRLAEAESCLAKLRGGHAGHAPSSLCSLPLRRAHERQEPSRQAIRALERLLDRWGDGSDGKLYRWLLNFSYMTVGGFPREVPAKHLLRTPFIDAFYGREAELRRHVYAHLRFIDRARELGVENHGTGRGVAAEDFDGDGDLDLIATGSFGGVRYYRNEGGSRFVDATAGSGLESVLQPLTVSMADHNGDGWMDLFVARPYAHYLLFANDGDGTFTDVTPRSGLLDSLPAGGIATTWMSTWGDVDNDGDLDLFVTNWAFRVPFVTGLAAERRQDSKLFLNEEGRFHDATADFGLAGRVEDRHLIGVGFGDYDGDGWLDLYLTGPMPGTSALLRNVRGRQGRRFEETGALDWHEPGFTAAFVDVDHDGRLDVFHGGFSDARTAVTQAVFGEHLGDYRSGHNAILLQLPGGSFVPRKDLFGGRLAMGSMGASFGDLDNDGCHDFYIGTGNPEPWFILPNLMYRGEERGGRCTGRMENISMLNGFGNVQKGHGIVFFDFDGDGDQDVYSSLGGMWPADPWPSQLFVNESATGNRWVKIRLRGRRSNRFGLGSRIEVRAAGEGGPPIVRTYLMDGKTCFGSAPYLAHIGLGRATRIREVRVTWLGSGCAGTYPARLGELNVLDEADCLRRGGET